MITRTLRTVGVVALGFAVVCSLGACSSSKKPVAMVSPDSMGMTNHQAMLVRGQKFTVRLPTHCGSQYAWRLTPGSADSRFATLLERKSQQVDEGMSSTLDEPAYDEFTFRATRTGMASLDFVYDSPWMIESAPARQYTLECDISKPMPGMPKMQQASVTVE